MSIEYNKEKELITVWLTNSDQQNPTVTKLIDDMREKYRNSKTKLVILKSGSGNLTVLTQSLFLRNKNCI